MHGVQQHVQDYLAYGLTKFIPTMSGTMQSVEVHLSK